jgi:YD repeat-containing protein
MLRAALFSVLFISVSFAHAQIGPVAPSPTSKDIQGCAQGTRNNSAPGADTGKAGAGAVSGGGTEYSNEVYVVSDKMYVTCKKTPKGQEATVTICLMSGKCTVMPKKQAGGWMDSVFKSVGNSGSSEPLLLPLTLEEPTPEQLETFRTATAYSIPLDRAMQDMVGGDIWRDYAYSDTYDADGNLVGHTNARMYPYSYNRDVDAALDNIIEQDKAGYAAGLDIQPAAAFKTYIDVKAQSFQLRTQAVSSEYQSAIQTGPSAHAPAISSFAGQDYEKYGDASFADVNQRQSANVEDRRSGVFMTTVTNAYQTVKTSVGDAWDYLRGFLR